MEETIDCLIKCRMESKPKKVGTIIQQPIDKDLKNAILLVLKEKRDPSNPVIIEIPGRFYKIYMTDDGCIRITEFMPVVGLEVLKFPEESKERKERKERKNKGGRHTGTPTDELCIEK